VKLYSTDIFPVDIEEKIKGQIRSSSEGYGGSTESGITRDFNYM
jgi:hypothetical protein